MREGATAETRAATERAVAHFNAGRYHEALDEFELPYHHFRGEGRELYLGFVRVSAALYHFAGGRFRSARRLYLSGTEILQRHGPSRDEFDVAALLVQLEGLFRPLLEADDESAPSLRPDSLPRIDLSGLG